MTRIRTLVAVFSLAVLAACGVDGDPERPEPRPHAEGGVTG